MFSVSFGSRLNHFSLVLSLARMSTAPKPIHVPGDKKSWNVEWEDYKPVVANGVNLRSKPWADPDIGTSGFHPKFNQLDGKIDRTSHTGAYMVDDGCYPLNPSGRTGICGRTRLGRWGPNHAADPVVTRWKRDSKTGDKVIHSKSGKAILGFVAIKRGDTGHWAIPGGMVDPGEKVGQTLRREFLEEALNGLLLDEKSKKEKSEVVDNLFNSGSEIFRGQVVTDPRNTDNSWMETVVYHVHDESGDIVGKLDLKAGDDAKEVEWKDIDSNLNLYADHKKFIQMIADRMNAHW